MAFSEDVLGRFDAYGWHTQRVEDGNDVEAIDRAITAAKADPRPSLIAVRTHIGYGAPTKHDTSKAHGSALGEEEVRGAKLAYGWDPDKHFFVPDEVLAALPPGHSRGREARGRLAGEAGAVCQGVSRRGGRARSAVLPRSCRTTGPRRSRRMPRRESVATRIASQQAINALAGTLPELFGGAADLSESNMTDIKDAGLFGPDNAAGRNLRFGVREHAMGAISTGIALSGPYIPYCATFMVFSDYMRGAVRLAAVSCQRVIYVWTHDSVAVGEDGPTHEPVEQIAALRAIPGLDVIRPGDANETAAAWVAAIERQDGPTALALTRQKIPVLQGTAEQAREGVARGGYVLKRESGGDGAKGSLPDLVMIATGSELQLAAAAAATLEAEGIRTRVVSLPCWERFERQDAAYRESVLPRAARKRVAIEAGVPFGWERYAGDDGAIIGIDHFGASAPVEEIMTRFGFTPERVTDIARKVVREDFYGFVPTLVNNPEHC